MENGDLVTVVVMVYRDFSGLDKTINSIVKQNYDNIELIVSDDGSTNYKPEYFNKYENICNDRFNYYSLIHNKENVGTVQHFNGIIKKSNGKIICPLSSGDIFIENNIIERIVDHFVKTDCYLCTAKRKELGGQERVIPNNHEISLLKNCNESLNYIMLYGNFIGGATTYYRRDVFDKYGFFDNNYKLCEDFPYFIKMLGNNIFISPLDFVTIGYDLSGISSGKKRNEILDKDYVNIFKNTLIEYGDKLSFFAKRATRYRIEKYGTDINGLVLTLKYIDIVTIVGLSIIISKWRK